MVGTVEIYRRDARIRRTLTGGGVGGGVRGEIYELSPQSRRRLSLYARNLSANPTVMVTLTLPGDWLATVPDGRALKRKWKAMKMWLERRGLGGMWFLEFQRRGAPHLHLALNGRVNKADLSLAWYRIVGSGDERHLRAGTKVESIRLTDGWERYCAKYASKFEQKHVPAYFEGVGRMWGVFGGVRCDIQASRSVSLAKIAPVIRASRRLSELRARAEGSRRAFRDLGIVGWTGYDQGPTLRRLLT